MCDLNTGAKAILQAVVGRSVDLHQQTLDGVSQYLCWHKNWGPWDSFHWFTSMHC
jgi:hypothetical protein